MILSPPITHPVPYTLLMFDADGTLRGCTVPGRPPNTPEEAVLLPGVEVILSRYAWKLTHYCGIASNQGGVALGYIPEATCAAMLRDLMHDASWQSWPEMVIRYCPHAPQAGCRCRKPAPAMLHDIMLYWHKQDAISGPADCLYIGDLSSDRDAAANAGIDFCFASAFFDWQGGAVDPELLRRTVPQSPPLP